MKRFHGIKSLYKRLPESVLFFIYRFFLSNYENQKPATVKRIDKLKLIASELKDVPMQYYFNGQYTLSIPNYTPKEPISISIKANADQHVESFKIIYFRIYKPRPDLTEHFWMSMEYKSNDTSIVNISKDLERHHAPMKRVWKLLMSCSVVIFDRFVKDVNPQTIQLDINTCIGEFPEYVFERLTSVRLVDAVRDAAKGRMIFHNMIGE